MRVTIHHTGSSNDTLESIDRSHKNRGFPESSLGYHTGYTYVIDKLGTYTQTRSETEEQAHTFGHNEDNIGICLIGNFTKEDPTDAQITALAELIEDIRNRWGFIPIHLHRELKATACPGIDLRALAEARQRSLLEYRLRTFLMTVGRITGARRRRIERELARLQG